MKRAGFPSRRAFSIRVALRDVQCPRCNGYGRPRIIALARHPSIEPNK
jgi:hypothetical protein